MVRTKQALGGYSPHRHFDHKLFNVELSTRLAALSMHIHVLSRIVMHINSDISMYSYTHHSQALHIPTSHVIPCYSIANSDIPDMSFHVPRCLLFRTRGF